LAAISYQIIDKEIKGMPKGIVTWFIDSKGFGFSICMAIAALLLSPVANVHAQHDHKSSFVKVSLQCTVYKGESDDQLTDDLLTAGLGWSGLQGGPPPFGNPNNPTAAEVRRLAIYTNYRYNSDIRIDKKI
jgi:hydroxybutyrate-dimer hydrolase